ncbi:MAG: cation:proton antiporter [Ilumatobacteraceae bacterium]
MIGLASTIGPDIGRLLLDLLIILVVAKAAAELSERLRLPAVLGEISAGILIGPSVLGAVHLTGERGVSIGVIAEIGVLLLLLQVGMEMDLGELGRVGKASLLVAAIGVVVPFGGGVLAGIMMGEDVKIAVFLGAALTATSVGITARVFGDLRALATTEARIVIGAAVADDVLGLVILTVVVKVVTGGSVGFGTVAGTLGLAIGFLLLTGLVGLVFVPRLLNLVHRHASSGGTLVVAGLVLTLGFAELADAAKLAFIIGAFMAGLSLGRSDHRERIGHDLGAIGNVFIPVFFVQIGINADLDAMVKPSVLGLAAVLTVVAIAGKMASAWGAVGTSVDKLLIGIGMIPRGEVGLIFASIGLANGVLDDDLFGALLVVVLVTTLVTPPLLRQRIGRDGRRAAIDAAPPTAEPSGGWLCVMDGEVGLRGVPPVTHTVPLALTTAGLLGDARPSPELFDWFGTHRHEALLWDAADTPTLLELLRTADIRAWRFLDASGVLERALPEVAGAMKRRRADVRDLDPLGALRFAVVDALQDLPTEGFAHDDDLVLAALAADVCDDSPNGRQCAVDLATRLGRAHDAERIACLVADAHLLRAGAGDPDVFARHELLQLATHLASSTHARQAYMLAIALGELPRWQREALDERYELVRAAIDHPEITGSGAYDLAGARLQAAQRLASGPATIERLRHASTSYLLTHDPGELARQAQLVEPLPRSGVVRVAVTADAGPNLWKIDVACRDRFGLLAHLTSALVAAGLDVTSASIATWPDGAVLDMFTVRNDDRPVAAEIASAMESALKRRLPKRAMPDLMLSVDNSSLPWHTACSVSGDDHPGALQAMTTAFAEAGVAVHTARVSSVGGRIADRFTVTDRLGRKLDDATTDRLRRTLAGDKVRRGRMHR